MMNLITVKRYFTSGTLKGLTIVQEYTQSAEWGTAIGDVHVVKRPIGGSPYIDKVISIIPKRKEEVS